MCNFDLEAPEKTRFRVVADSASKFFKPARIFPQTSNGQLSTDSRLATYMHSSDHLESTRNPSFARCTVLDYEMRMVEGETIIFEKLEMKRGFKSE